MRATFRHSLAIGIAAAILAGAPAAHSQVFGTGPGASQEPAPINSGVRRDMHNSVRTPFIPIEVGGVFLTRLGEGDSKHLRHYVDRYMFDATEGEQVVLSVKADRPLLISITGQSTFGGIVAKNFDGSPFSPSVLGNEIAGFIPRSGKYSIMVRALESGAAGETDYDLALHSNLRPLGSAKDPTLRDVPVAASAVTTPEAQTYAKSKPEALRPFYKTLYADGEHSAVLNFQRLGLAAMETGHYEQAEWAFDEALERIEAIYGRNAVSDAARSKWTAESIKDFKGEPYERAMAYYYRGLLYLRAGDYENARASFAMGEYQDTLSEAEQYQGDFAALTWLSGWASHCLGNANMAAEQFAIAAEIQPRLQAPGLDANLLVIAEVGNGPIKIRGGEQNQWLKFASPARTSADAVEMTVGGSGPLPMVEASSVHHQATTRGGRAVDYVLNGKAKLKAYFNATLFGVGTGVNNLVKSEADIRMWDTLPDSLMFATTKAAPGFTVTPRFSLKGRPVEAPVEPVAATAGRCALAWTRSSSALAVDAGVPGNDPRVIQARNKLDVARQADQAFRESLDSAD